MQKLLRARGGLKAYLAAPDMLVTEESRQCPLCPSKHRLRRHGHYQRFVVVPGSGTAERIPIQRLFCVETRRTVSLLPDFCIPRRQHGPAVLGTFLDRYVKGRSLLSALREARPDAPGHSVAQSLRDGFLARAGPIRTYLGRLRPRVIEIARTATGRRREVAALLTGLCHGFKAASDAFVRHGVGLHEALQVGLA